jgi:hypothetical protein
MPDGISPSYRRMRDVTGNWMQLMLAFDAMFAWADRASKA